MPGKIPTWDAAYAQDRPPIWDTGRPQQAFYSLAASGLLQGRVLDAGCGTGEHTLMASAWGAQAVGTDISPRAVAEARRKAAARESAARFEVADALCLAGSGARFRTVIDCGLFHCFTPAQAARYVAGLASVLEHGGWLHLMCYSDFEPGRWGPRRVSREDLHQAFPRRRGWAIASIEPKALAVSPPIDGRPYARAWLAAIRRDR